jgi:hypothetical protein
MRFTCSTCGRVHEGLPDISFDAPIYYARVPEGERASRSTLSSDLCVIDSSDFFARGVLEIPIKEAEDVFGWGPWFGWLSNRLPGYPDTLNLRTHLHLRASGWRSFSRSSDHGCMRARAITRQGVCENAARPVAKQTAFGVGALAA